MENAHFIDHKRKGQWCWDGARGVGLVAVALRGERP